MKKSWGYLLILVLLTLGMMTAAYGADSKIDQVKITFSYDEEPKSGNAIGSISAETESREFTIDHVEYVTDAEEWSVGDRPVVRVEMTAKDGYRFAYTSKSHFTVSGGGAEFKKARYYDDKTVMELEVYLKRIGGRLSASDNLEWNGAYAEWEELNGSKSYEVRLYRDGKVVTTVSTTGITYNFSAYMTKAGTYTFRVRGIAKYDDKAGEWSEHSYEYDVDKNDIGHYPDSAGWKQDQYGWWYSYGNGLYPADNWEYIGGAWYYFNGQGYMMTGWQLINESWYYLQPGGMMATGWQAVNGSWYYLHSSGIMLTGWQLINNRWYYLADNGVMLSGWQYLNNCWYYLEGSGAMVSGWQYINSRWYYLAGNGVMLSGWQYINNRWYYFDGSGAMVSGWQFLNDLWYYFDGNGAMLANQMTPDGHYVDSSGVMVY